MAATTDFNAGIDTSDVEVSYKKESKYGEAIVGTVLAPYQKLRLTSEGFSEEKTRSRPAEIRADGQAVQAITTQVAASGSLGLAYSAGTYDDLLLGMINADAFAGGASLKLTTTATTALHATDILTLTGTVIADADPVGTVLASFKKDETVYVSGFIGDDAVYNGVYTLTTNGAPGSIKLTNKYLESLIADGTPAAVNTVVIKRCGYAINAVSVSTYAFQKKFKDDLYLNYPGCYITSGSVNASLGGFLEGTFEFLAKNENIAAKGLEGTGSGVILKDAPEGRVIDTIEGVQNAMFADKSFTETGGFDTILQSIAFTVTKENARSQYGIGSPDAQGIGRGTLTIAGTLSVYFRNDKLYNEFKNETSNTFAFDAVDNDGRGYQFSFPNVTIINPTVVAGGPDTDMLAEFTLEANPGKFVPTDKLHTIRIDKI